MKIPITKPVFDDREREMIVKPLESGWMVQGPYVAEFERLFAEFAGARYAKATTSCTTALHIALESVGIGPGDKVIVPSFTYIASANAVEYTGAEVVFCDIDLKTFNIDPDKCSEILEEDKDRRIKAIMPVNLFGLCANLPRFSDMALKYDLKIIEDSACGLGAYIGSKHSGTFGDIGCFSFHPRKAITVGEGGMVITDVENIAHKISLLRDHGAGKSDFKRHSEGGGTLLPEFNVKGYNYRMTDIQGALGVCQMEKALSILDRRKAVADRYNEALENADKLVIPHIPEKYTHAFQSYVCLFTGLEDLTNLTMDKVNRLNVERNSYMMKLENRGIAVRQGTHAVHTLGYYRNKYGLDDERFPASYAADRLSVTLPLYAEMTDEEFCYVITNIEEVLRLKSPRR